MRWRLPAALALLLAAAAPAVGHAAPRVGFVVHFDCLRNEAEARTAVLVAAGQGARVLSVVPPAHVWENRQALAMLDIVLAEAAAHELQIVFMRIDAAYPADRRGRRENYLYAHVLTEPGRMSDGRPSHDFFLTTAGRAGYAEWMEEETRYYARRFGGLPNLIGFSLGPFVEPFASERGAFLEWDPHSERYELTQYTPEALRLWHEWLRARYADVATVNREYAASFADIDAVPLPKTDADERFGRSDLAYFDFVRTLNDWFQERYRACRRIWHEEGGRADTPFILQFSGLEAEKLAKGRPGLAAFDLPGWIADADAVGLSLYSNGGYEDHGHASIVAMVRLTATAREMGKDVFVLESGYEAPNVRADARELNFLADVAARVGPRTFIYEFLKDKFDESYARNPGKVMRADGRLRPAAVRAVQGAFARAVAETPVEAPVLRVSVDPAALRGDPRLGRLAVGLFDLAGTVPVRWGVAGSAPEKDDGVPVVRIDTNLCADSDLHEALLAVPAAGADERAAWRGRVAALLSTTP
jgi:hypothetical protein